MSDARNDILAAISAAISKDVDNKSSFLKRSLTQSKSRLTKHPSNLIPARGNLGQKARIDLFIREAERVSSTVARVSCLDGVPREIVRFLTKNSLPMTLKTSPETSEKTIPWSSQALLNIEEGPADGTEHSCVSNAIAGVAETGTIVVISGQNSSTTLNFLPPTLVCLVHSSEIVGDYEAVWRHLRTKKQEGSNIGFLPRTVNWITGPSRTADIEQTLLLGAHGPQRLHIVIIDD
jgi:L-lactate dehydrogenase complex protein LldG